MQNKTTRIIMILILLIPIRSFSMVDTIEKAGVGAGIFVGITLLVVIAFVLNKIITKKQKSIKKPILHNGKAPMRLLRSDD